MWVWSVKRVACGRGQFKKLCVGMANPGSCVWAWLIEGQYLNTSTLQVMIKFTRDTCRYMHMYIHSSGTCNQTLSKAGSHPNTLTKVGGNNPVHRHDDM